MLQSKVSTISNLELPSAHAQIQNFHPWVPRQDYYQVRHEGSRASEARNFPSCSYYFIHHVGKGTQEFWRHHLNKFKNVDQVAACFKSSQACRPKRKQDEAALCKKRIYQCVHDPLKTVECTRQLTSEWLTSLVNLIIHLSTFC